MRLFDLPSLAEGRPPVTGALDDMDDLSALAAEFPAYDFGASWVTVGSGPDVRKIWAWPLDGGPAVTAFDAEEIRRAIREAGGG